MVLRFDGPGTISGGGLDSHLDLLGSHIRVLAKHPGDRLTINASDLAGQGNLEAGQSTITNNGNIHASGDGGTLTIQPGGGTADLINNGRLSATSGGILVVTGSGATVTNHGSFIL